MSISDNEPPTYQISSAEDRDAILSEVVAHAALQEAQYKQPIADPTPPGRWKTPLALVVILLAGVLAAFPPGWVRGEWPPALTDADQVRGLRAILLIQAEQLEAYRLRNGRLPASLSELPVYDPAVRFVRSNNRVYQLVAAAPDGRNLVYDSTRPSPDFKAVAGEWLPGEGSSP